LQALQSPGRRVIARRERPHPGAQLRGTVGRLRPPQPVGHRFSGAGAAVAGAGCGGRDVRGVQGLRQPPRGDHSGRCAGLRGDPHPVSFGAGRRRTVLGWVVLLSLYQELHFIEQIDQRFSKRQMAYVDERQGCGIVFQRGDPTSFLAVAQCHATFGRARPPGRVRSDRHGRLGHAQRVRTGSLPLEPLVKRSQHAVHLVLNVTGSQ
jgi:hypothetical protein